MKLIALIILSLASLNTFSKSGKIQPLSKQDQLLKMIEEEKKTINRLSNLGPRLQWRLFELESEKLRIIREKENKAFLENSRPGILKSTFFKYSNRFYKSIRSEGLKIIKKYPHFKNNADIYYSLALNARDMGIEKEENHFLYKALAKTRSRTLTYNIKMSLAEHHYNSKNYKKAIQFYTPVIENKSDDWYTKHLFNLSWCYVKTKKYDKAIELAKQSIESSRDKRYVDISPQVFESIGLFFVLAEKEQEGTQYYLDNHSNPTEYLLKMAKKTATDKGFNKAHYIYSKTLEMNLDRKIINSEIETRIDLLDFYRNFKQFDLFYDNTTSLVALKTQNHLKGESLESVIEKVMGLTGYLQIKFTKNQKINITNYDQSEKKQIISFFDSLNMLDTKNTDNYTYLQAETFYSTSSFKEAFGYYENALNNSINLNKSIKISDEKNKLRTKIFDGLLSILEKGFLKEKQITVYKKHIELFPKNERSRVLHSRVFNIFLEENNTEQMEKAVAHYNKDYSEDLSIQKQMYIKYMDVLIKQKNIPTFAVNINKIKAGYLSLENSYINESIKVLGQLLFSKYQDIKDSAQQLDGYKSLYDNELYPREIKEKSSLKLLSLNAVQNNYDQVETWFNNWFTISNNKEKEKNIAFSSQLVNKLLLTGNLNLSNNIGLKTLTQRCTKKDKHNDELFNTIITSNLLRADFNSTMSSINLKKCLSEKYSEIDIHKQISSHYLKNQEYKFYFSYKKRYPNFLREEYEQNLVFIYWDSVFNEKTSMAESIMRLLKSSKSSLITKAALKEINNYDLYKKFVAKIPSIQEYKYANFNEEKFNDYFEKNMSLLNSIEQQSQELIKEAHLHYLPLVYSRIINSYVTFAKYLENVTPNNQPIEYVTGFKNAMKGPIGQLYRKSQKLKENLLKTYQKNELLSPNISLINSVEPINNMHTIHLADQYPIVADGYSLGK